MRKVLITGSAGFIGYHLSQLLLDEGFVVFGIDGISDYYDVKLKKRRHANLLQNQNFQCAEVQLQDFEALQKISTEFAPDIIVHLAAQAGVRYSLENPRSYIDSNVTGTFNVMECAREQNVEHLLMASTSSVYGANTEMPFAETHKADTPLTIYAASKKANEAMAHSYAHLYKIPTTMFRFFTVYGPWGRPDMALFKFVDAAINNRPIDVYNNGEMWRDFTYVSDLVTAIRLLIDAKPVEGEPVADYDTLSPAAPYRVVNIGNNDTVKLTDFIDHIESALGVPIVRNYMEMQTGDVPATWANSELLKTLTGYCPKTSVKEGVESFVDWYKQYYQT